MQLYQVMQAVKVINEQSQFHGKAGCVVSVPRTDADPVGVKLDVDNQVHEFAQSDIQGL